MRTRRFSGMRVPTFESVVDDIVVTQVPCPALGCRVVAGEWCVTKKLHRARVAARKAYKP